MHRTGLRALGAAALVTSLALTGACGSSGGEKPSYQNGGTFTVSIASDPQNLDPLKATDVITNEMDYFAYDTLINLDSKGNIVPQLATKWDVTPTTVTFTLRPGVTCADGTPLTASAVAANYTFIQNPANQSTAIGSQLPDTNFTVAHDDTAGTVTITMAKPFGFLLTGAGMIPIVCPKGTADRKLLEHGTDGTGPYTLTESVAGDHYTFTVRPGYKWGPGGAGTDAAGIPTKVVLKVVQSESTAVNMFLGGQLSAVGVSGADKARLEGHGYGKVNSGAGSSNDLFFNERTGHPGADPAVRKALAMDLDLPALIKVMTENSGQAPTDLEPNSPKPCTTPTVTGNLQPHDAAGAASALDAAGWTKGADGTRSKNGAQLKLTLVYPSGTPSEDAGMELVASWWKDLGATVTLKAMDTNALIQMLFGNGEAWDVAALGIGVSYPSQLVGYLSGPVPPNGQNFSGIVNADYTSLAGQAVVTPGPAGCDLWAQAEKSLFSATDLVPVSITYVPTYTTKATFVYGNAGPEPTSIRLLK